jgi:hypothetical protein
MRVFNSGEVQQLSFESPFASIEKNRNPIVHRGISKAPSLLSLLCAPLYFILDPVYIGHCIFTLSFFPRTLAHASMFASCIPSERKRPGHAVV